MNHSPCDENGCQRASKTETRNLKTTRESPFMPWRPRRDGTHDIRRNRRFTRARQKSGYLKGKQRTKTAHCGQPRCNARSSRSQTKAQNGNRQRAVGTVSITNVSPGNLKDGVPPEERTEDPPH